MPRCTGFAKMLKGVTNDRFLRRRGPSKAVGRSEHGVGGKRRKGERLVPGRIKAHKALQTDATEAEESALQIRNKLADRIMFDAVLR